MSEFLRNVVESIRSKRSRVGLIGLGYVGLPLARAFSLAGFPVLGFDIDEGKVAALRQGRSYIGHVSDHEIHLMRRSGFEATGQLVRLWDGPAGKRIRELPKAPKHYDDGNSESRGIDLTPDGKRVAMIFRGPAHEVGGRVVEVETDKEVCALVPQPLPRFGGATRFGADGKRVAQVSTEVARIWNAEQTPPCRAAPRS